MNAEDSTLKAFTYTKSGIFTIKLTSGKYLLLVNYKSYADFVTDFTLDSLRSRIDFGQISLMLRSELLDEVIVKAQRVPVRIKGDTTEFNAEAFTTQKNAKVDQLLQQLPGMRIDKNGGIMFQGESIGKVLVDGEEFFADDPTLVTKNVRADMVSKIQVYNQKSDQSRLSGIDDGVKIKVLNVQLREDKSKGIFGNTLAGAGTRQSYVGQGIINKFSREKKMAAYGNITNTAENGFGSGSGGYNGVGLPQKKMQGCSSIANGIIAKKA